MHKIENEHDVVVHCVECGGLIALPDRFENFAVLADDRYESDRFVVQVLEA